MRTALRLRQYDDVLDPADVYAFLALVGFHSNFYGTCSKVRVTSRSRFKCNSCSLQGLHGEPPTARKQHAQHSLREIQQAAARSQGATSTAVAIIHVAA